MANVLPLYLASSVKKILFCAQIMVVHLEEYNVHTAVAKAVASLGPSSCSRSVNIDSLTGAL